jgi:hypothetical protein
MDRSNGTALDLPSRVRTVLRSEPPVNGLAQFLRIGEQILSQLGVTRAFHVALTKQIRNAIDAPSRQLRSCQK